MSVLLQIQYPNLYGYEPSKGLAIAAIAAFSLVTIIITILTIKFKKWYFFIISIAGAVEVAGYGTRLLSANDTHNLGVYIATTLLILLPPTALACADYILVSKVMKKTGISHPIFKPKFVKFFFLGIDVFSLIIQSTGGALLSQAKDNLQKPAEAIMLLGLSVALASFVFFFFIVIYIHYKIRNVQEPDSKWRRIIYALYITVFLLVLRSIYRVCEYAGGWMNPIQRSEPTFYACDTLLIFFLMCVWVPLHPGFFNLKPDNSKSKPTVTRGDVEME
ncbi:hypothetical protein DLAC_11728 [Tieghemostelium lacteum]|uniref:RTA1-like protein n=1 Tax=Tieghemostelium lacteum TaxID=361077 RepID=A0A151Z7N8_TIELA|nr:hypothetical protein DLAC_11728 [Tieghemostelium lacteum]|eukprot:KYQ89971.1 hypothetical protein DLAC_11728 [Tieghemostelium lacteum]